eukprot:CAMPEP_0172540188 /NCGR_PEP_ID=MMETSP1067-20121228/11256_1 /TAXON_ID=265564 ORGANISM="Thalassiosira punctigera, Strain Tpunct2005C2" /NCGR_SAMPLE_ID=MMETSP1067 /ASSEMBLY_ACC=CAM_ASM_000444 /LENGTH=236 /DNA_ID=CAMNT_0013325997 /DNA_START=124 /DNA_END=832 /DNA_ORIENTATION=-
MSSFVAINSINCFPTSSILGARRVLDRELARRGPRGLILDAQDILPAGNSGEPALGPIHPPAVAYDPVLHVVLFPPPDDGHDVVVVPARLLVVEDLAPHEILKGVGLNGRRDWSASVNLFLDLHHAFLGGVVRVVDLRVLGDGRVGEDVERGALAPVRREGAAGPARVEGTACGVDVLAEALLGVRRAGDVWLARVIRDEAVVVNELVYARVRAAVAGPGHVMAAVQHELDAQIDV